MSSESPEKPRVEDMVTKLEKEGGIVVYLTPDRLRELQSMFASPQIRPGEGPSPPEGRLAREEAPEPESAQASFCGFIICGGVYPSPPPVKTK
jgi:hypothetical protein